jgi:hypothetical protein
MASKKPACNFRTKIRCSHRPLIQVLRRLRQKDFELKVTVVLHNENLSQKTRSSLNTVICYIMYYARFWEYSEKDTLLSEGKRKLVV